MRFALKALDAANQVVSVQLDAADETAVREAARQRGYAVLSLRRRGIGFGRQAFATTVFSIELLALLDAGLNVVEAIQTLADKEPAGESRQLLGDLLEALRRGESLSQAIGHFPAAFPTLYAATVRSSEQTGNIKEALGRYIAYREQLDQVRKKVAASLLYPGILLVVGSLVFAFLLFYVVPRFARVYEGVSADLPLFSSLLLALGSWIGRNGTTVALTLAGAAVLAAFGLARPEVRLSATERLWRIPTLGARLRIYQLARFYRTAGMLLRSGVPALRALGMVADLLPPALSLQLSHATRLLEEGQPFSAALTSAGLATPVATRMMAVGEQSGQMGELMDRIARFYDEETARFLDAFTRVFEPVVMIVLGLAVGGIVVLMYMPIFELAGSVR